MNRRTTIIAITVVAVLGVAGGIWWLTQPVPSEDVTAGETNTALYNQLSDAGIDGALVDVTDERALVRYDIDGDQSIEASQKAALTAAATVVTDDVPIVVETYQETDPVERLVLEPEDAAAYRDGELSPDELHDRASSEELS